jgi:FkbM family methyltransferase
MTYDTKPVRSPKGNDVELLYREDTSDLGTIGATWRLWDKLEDEYGLANLPDDLSGTAIDIGAHIGSVALALAIDNPMLLVIAVEPVAENCEVIAASIQATGLRNVIVHEAALGTDHVTVNYTAAETADAAGRYDTRWVGNVFREQPGDTRPVVQTTLSAILDMNGIDRVRFAKTDCEGGEWAMFDDPAISRVDLMHGEFHDRKPDDLAAALLPTHDLWIAPGDVVPNLFRAVAR